ncbi:MAG: hypothetical protein WCW14_00155 [Candidatus Paceibacterota bacterium]|jgi:hypothetical protein
MTYLVHTHRHGFRAGKPAKILGVRFVTPKGHAGRVCYHVRFRDGKEDFVPLADQNNFKIISAADVRDGNIPEVTD